MSKDLRNNNQPIQKTMKQILIGILLLPLLLVGCKNKTEEALIRPVRTMTISSVKELTGAKFPGISQEVQTVEMAFRVAGPLVKLNAVEGQKVMKGQLIAEIDSRDFRVDLSAKEGRYVQAKTEEERFRELLTRNAVSQNEYDQKQAVYLEAKSAYEAAKNALVDVRLVAPFDCFIDQKFVENFQRVTIGQPIVSLLDLSSMEVKFSVPDQVAMLYRNYDYFLVVFDAYPDKQFEADMKQVEKKSVGSAGIPVTIVLRDKNILSSENRVTPGMSCNVQVVLKKDESTVSREGIAIPITAVYEVPENDQKYVWVLSDSMLVSKRMVKIGTLSGADMILITDGLTQGETVVVAGGNRLSENQKVKLLTTN